MDLDMDMDLRWGDLHAPTKTFSHYGSIHKVVRDLNSSPLRQYQRSKVLKNGIYIERGIRKKYGSKLSIIDKIKRYLNPHIDKAFGCIQRGVTPPSGEIVNDVTSSYVLNATKKDFDYLDDTVEKYSVEEQDSAYAVCYSFKRSPVEDLKKSSEILRQDYIKESVTGLTQKGVGSGVTYLMITSDGECRTSKSLEEAHTNSLFSCKNIPDSSYWLISPVSYKMMLKEPIWNRDISKKELYETLKVIGSVDYKIDYWDKMFLKGHEKSEKVLENFGKFCLENHEKSENVAFMLDLTKIYPERADEITEDIYKELSHKDLDYNSFEKQAEAIVEGYML
ncbi:MAG: hypothetical protein ACOC53_05490 [Candidatus Saliniplasma sp.]